MTSQKSVVRSETDAQARSVESATFLKRALIFQAELQAKRFPNASTLAEMCKCSRSTAMRTIDRLRYEFGAPIEYDETHRGYFLSREGFSLAALPARRDELTVLLLLCEFASIIDDASLENAVTSLWTRITAGRSDVEHELRRVRECFSFELGSIARLKKVGIVQLLGLCYRGQTVRIRYRLPMSRFDESEIVGLCERLHLLHGVLYVFLRDPSRRRTVINAAFIEEITEISDCPSESPEGHASRMLEKDPLDTMDGNFQGRAEIVEITIPAPAAHFFAEQVWHKEQEDRWQEGALVRRFPARVSPDLARRILGLGRFIASVKPSYILDQIRADVANLSRLCGGVKERVSSSDTPS